MSADLGLRPQPWLWYPAKHTIESEGQMIRSFWQSLRSMVKLHWGNVEGSSACISNSSSSQAKFNPNELNQLQGLSRFPKKHHPHALGWVFALVSSWMCSRILWTTIFMTSAFRHSFKTFFCGKCHPYLWVLRRRRPWSCDVLVATRMKVVVWCDLGNFVKWTHSSFSLFHRSSSAIFTRLDSWS
jgi:hypothetical protein